MAGFKNIKAYVDAYDAGQTKFSSWRKQPTQTTGSGVWFDLSMSPGNPVPNYYIGVPGVFTRMARSTDSGIDHGGAVSPKTKHLKMLHAQTATATAVPLPMILYDCVGFYPFIDESVTDWQYLDNTLAPNRWLADEPVATLGPELAANSDCTNGVVGFTSLNGAGTLSNPDGNAVRFTCTNPNAYMGHYTTVEIGSTYVFEYRFKTVSLAGAGAVYAMAGNTAGANKIDYLGITAYHIGGYAHPPTTGTMSSVGVTRSFTFTARTTTFNLQFQLNGSVTIGDYIELEYISVKKVTSVSKTNMGFQIMPIVVAGQAGGQYVTLRYTNQDGIPNRHTVSNYGMTTQAVNGACLLPTNGGPFIALQPGDTGVRSIEAVLMLGADIGLFAAALVKPIASHSIYDITAPAERDYLLDSPSLPVIPDDAYLNLVVCPNGTLANAPIYGTAEFIWS